MRIVYVRGDKPIKQPTTFKKDVEEFKKIFIEEHNRKYKSSGRDIIYG